VNLLHPDTIWLLVPIVFLGVVSVIVTPRGSRLRGAVRVLLRCAMAAALVLALATPYTSEKRPLEAVTALLDISASITESQGDELLAKAHTLAEQLSVPLMVAPFAGSAVTRAVSISKGDSFRGIRSAWQTLDTGGTDIARAIEGRANLTAPFALLLTDGYETAGSAREVVARNASRPLFPLSSTGEDGDTEVAISQLHAPRSVPAQRSAEIRTTISSRAKGPTIGELQVRHGESVVLKRSVTMAPGSDLSVVAESDPNLEGLLPIQATLSWRDSEGQHSVTRTTWISGEKRDKVLLISGTAEDDRFLSQILKSQAYQLRSLVAASSREEQRSVQASDYKVIVLNNVALSGIPDTLLSELRTFVRDGGGLVVVGGGSAYGLGGYIGSRLEELLPVKLLPPQPEKKRVTIGVQLVVDKSRSMATDNRLEFAKAAAEEVVRNLKDDDFIGVIGFDEVPFIALPVSRLSQVRDTAISRISRLFPTSRTNLFPALDEARRGLAATPAGRKHVIVLTDGKLPDPGPYYFDLIKQMRFVGITVSTVMVGNEADDGFLAQMAQAGGGAFYQTNDPANLPKVFLSDVKVASGERTMREEPEMSVRPGPDPLVSTRIETYPILRGFVQTAEREKAQTELLVRDTEGTHPLLASWNIGEGRVVAFTSDANGRWSSNWIRWERIQEFWSDLVEASRRRDSESAPARVEFDLRSWVAGGEVVIDLALFADVGRRTIRGQVTRPDGGTSSVEFVAEKPGHFMARLGQAAAGTYRAKISLTTADEGQKGQGAQELPEVAWEIDGAQFGEQPHRKPALQVLGELARASGGVVDPAADDLRPLMQRETEKRLYTHELLVVALGLFLLELLLRMVQGRMRVAAFRKS
jgi:Ca-activated chloride channel family protein